MESILHSAFMYEQLGLASNALTVLKTINEGDPLLPSLLTQYSLYCSLLYTELLDPFISFVDWLVLSDTNKLQHVLAHWSLRLQPQQSLCELFSLHLAPLFTSEPTARRELLQWLHKIGQSGTIEAGAEFSSVGAWEDAFIEAIAFLLKQQNPQVFEMVAELAEASIPTTPKERRCIRSVATLVRLVVRCCEAFDSTEQGLVFMWR